LCEREYMMVIVKSEGKCIMCPEKCFGGVRCHGLVVLRRHVVAIDCRIYNGELRHGWFRCVASAWLHMKQLALRVVGKLRLT
jgi:hypothetical protein